MIDEGKYGLRHRRSNYDDASLPLKLPLLLIALAAAVSFVIVKSASRDAAQDASRPKTLEGMLKKSPVAAKTQPDSFAGNRAEKWLRQGGQRNVSERMLLERLAEAERRGDEELVFTTLETMRQRPALLDLEDAVASRIGQIRKRRLFEADFDAKEPDESLVTRREIRRSDTLERLAREYGTTVDAIRRMNNLAPGAPLSPPGRIVRLLKFPRVLLAVRKRSGFIDLYINERFFSRYYASMAHCREHGVFRTSESDSVERLFAAFSITTTPEDMAEISALCPPATQIAISN